MWIDEYGDGTGFEIYRDGGMYSVLSFKFLAKIY